MALSLVQNFDSTMSMEEFQILSLVPSKHRTEEVVREAICRHGGDALCHCPRSLLGPKDWAPGAEALCYKAVTVHQGNGDTYDHKPLHYVPGDQLTVSLCEVAVTIDPWSIVDVPMGMRTRELCLMCINAEEFSLGLLSHMPEEHLDQELIYRALRACDEGPNCVTLDDIPEEFHTFEVCALAFQSSFDCGELSRMPPAFVEEILKRTLPKRVKKLGELPKQHLSRALCESIISAADPNDRASWMQWLWKDLPKEFQLPSVAKGILAKEGTALGAVDPDMITLEMCEIAVRQNGKALKSVPGHLCSQHLCNTAVTQDGAALRFVPPKFRTEATCRLAVMKNPVAIRSMPRSFLDNALLEYAAMNGALRQIPPELRSYEICLKAVRMAGEGMLHLVPETHRDKALCVAALEKDPGALPWVPRPTAEMCKTAVRGDGLALALVPPSMITPELCETAVEQSGVALIYVPEQFLTEKLMDKGVAFYSEKLKRSELLDDDDDDDSTFRMANYYFQKRMPEWFMKHYGLEEEDD